MRNLFIITFFPYFFPLDFTREIFFSQNDATYKQARKLCKKKNRNLAVLETEKELKQLQVEIAEKYNSE